MQQKQQSFFNSTQNSCSQLMCRICCMQDTHTNLISPCYCKGSIKYTHKQCLLDWSTKKSIQILNVANKRWYTHCELCKFRIPIKTKHVISLNTQNQFRQNFKQYWWITLIFVFGIIYGLLTLISLLLNIFNLFLTIEIEQSTVGYVFGWDSRATILSMMISVFNSLLFFSMFFLTIDKVAYDFDLRGEESKSKHQQQQNSEFILKQIQELFQKKIV